MGPRWLFVVQVLLYSAFPIYFATLRSGMRLVLLYLYIGTVLTVGGFLGAVHSYPLTDGVAVSAGSVAYGALLMSTIVLVIVGRDLQVVRNVIRIVIVVDLFKIALFQVTSSALRSDEFPNPFATSPEVFTVSLRVVAVGGVLIVVELLALLLVFDKLKAWSRNPWLLSAGYVGSFVAVVCLDGLLFPLAAVSPEPVGDLIVPGVQSKLLLALAYSVPLVAFLVAFRSSIAAFEATSLRVQELFYAPRDDILRELESERAAHRESERQFAESATLAKALAALDTGSPLDRMLEDLGRVLWRLPGVRAVPLGLVAVITDTEVVELGARSGTALPTVDEVRARSSDEPWGEWRGLDRVICVPLGDTTAPAVLEVFVQPAVESAVLAPLRDAGFQVGALLRPSLARASQTWKDRSPILSIISTRAVEAVFQPIVSLNGGEIVAFEGLSRFEPETSPEGRFREAAVLGLDVELELLAIRTLLDAARELPAGVAVSLNVSPTTLLSPELGGLLAECDRPLSIEVTEHSPVHDYETLIHALEALGDVRFVVDDAGSGYASLQHILRLHPDEVKLDRAWVQDIDGDRPRQVLVGGLNSFVTEIGAVLVAEGIERPEEWETLRSLGVSRGQGYLFARPAPASTFRAP